MGCISSKFHDSRVKKSASRARFTNLKSWIGRKCPLPNKIALRWRNPGKDPLNQSEQCSNTPSPTDPVRCRKGINMRAKRDFHVSDEVIDFEDLSSCPCPRGLKKSCRHRENVQLLRDIMALEGFLSNEVEAELFLNIIRSDMMKFYEGLKESIELSLTDEEEEEIEERIDKHGFLVIKSYLPPAPKPNGGKSRHQQMKDVCHDILQELATPEEDEEHEEEEIKIETSDSSGGEEMGTVRAGTPRRVDTNKVVDLAINGAFKRWHLPTPDNQPGIYDIIRSSLSRAASTLPDQQGSRAFTSDNVSTVAASKDGPEAVTQKSSNQIAEYDFYF